MAFDIKLSDDAERQIKKLSARDQKIILNAIDKHLRFQPDQPTRNRKRLRENPLAPWELRVGHFRVFYDILEEDQIVAVVAIAEKVGNKFFIEGEGISAMKTLALEKEKRSVTELLATENGKEVIYLTQRNRVTHALVPLDDMDREVLAIRNNPELMAYIDACCARARKAPGKSLEQVREELGIPPRKRKPRPPR